MNGKIINIQRFCVDDGPGIRTTVFLKGCPLACIWCHNPESQDIKNEILYNPEKCIHCGKCGNVCPNEAQKINKYHTFDRTKCKSCGVCATVCPTSALELYGKIMSAQQVFEEVERDRIFYETSNGGVTVSGGEPLSQPAFTAELLALCKKAGIHTAVETSGFASELDLISVIKQCDIVLFDIKETDEKKHKAYTGRELKTILHNLEIVNAFKIPFVIRAPIIPSLNDEERHFLALKKLQDSMEYCQGVQIMPYHKIGAYKYEFLQRKYACQEIKAPSDEMIKSWRAYFE